MAKFATKISIGDRKFDIPKIDFWQNNSNSWKISILKKQKNNCWQKFLNWKKLFLFLLGGFVSDYQIFDSTQILFSTENLNFENNIFLSKFSKFVQISFQKFSFQKPNPNLIPGAQEIWAEQIWGPQNLGPQNPGPIKSGHIFQLKFWLKFLLQIFNRMFLK